MPDTLDRLTSALADRYKIERRLGEGGMATVYLAEDLKHRRPVAIKVLRPELAAALGTERFLREIEVAARLTHPHILPLHDSGAADGLLYYVMPYVEGESLRERLTRETQLPLNDALQIAREVASALGTAHRHGIVHRDIKPENILLQEGHAVVSDFGIAKAITVAGGEQLTATGLSLGTPHYMSPEQASGEADVDGRCDVYALGCVLYEMLAGEPPYGGPTAQVVIAKQLADPVPAVRRVRTTVPEHVDRAITMALAKAKADRFPTIERFAEAVAVPGVRASSTRRRSLIGAAVAVLLAVLVGSNVGGLRDRLSRTFGAAQAPPAALSLAVLPFENLSTSPEHEYLGDGMTAELISKLSRIGNLHVSSRTSVVRFKDTDQDIREIAQELGVGYVLEGSVRRAGDRVRITTQLIDASTGFRLWSEDLDGELTDVLVLQEEAALQIVEALDLRLSRQEASAVHLRHTEDPRAYDAYLRGWALLESFHSRVEVPKEGLDAAQEHFQRAIAFDRDYAPALAGLSWLDSYYHFFDIDRSPERLRRAERLARRALTLAPELPEAHAAMAELRAREERWAAAIDGYREALRLDPGNAIVWCHLAWVCNTKDPPDLEQAERSAREAVRLHPTYFWSYAVLGTALAMQERYEEAIASFEFALQLSPDYRDGHVYLGGFHRTLGDYDRALGHYEQAGAMGETPELVVLISSTHVGRGDTAKALAELERALAGGYRDFAAIEDSPYFKPLSRLPRFQALLARYRD